MPLQLPNAVASQIKDTRTLRWATCWRITLTTIADRVYRFTDHTESLEFPTGEVFAPPDGMDGTAVQRKDGFKSQNRDVRGLISDTQITDADLTAGLFIGALVEEYLVDTRSASITPMMASRYYVKETQFDGAEWVAEIDGVGSQYSQPVGEYWSKMCRVEVFSQGLGKCNVSPAAFTETVAIAAVTDPRRAYTFTIVNGLWNESFFGNDGFISYLSGANKGFQARIRLYSAIGGTGSVALQGSTPYDMQIGDLVTMLPGCNKQAVGSNTEVAHCRERYDNILNFQGEPFIPGGDRARKGITIR